MINHTDRAEELFLQGYNCAQAVFLAFSDVTGIGPETGAKLAAPFGGGMGRMREVCGAVSGALMALGLWKGYADPKDQAAKREHYALVQEFARRFREARGSIICRELLAGVQTGSGSAPEPRTPAYYHARPCVLAVRTAAEILEELL